MRYATVATTLSLSELAGLSAPCRTRSGADGQTVGSVRTPRPVPARPRRAGQSPSDAGRAGHDGGVTPAPLRDAERGWAEQYRRALACRDTAPAADVISQNAEPFVRPAGLALPEWGEHIPSVISFDFDADATTREDAAAEQKRLAALCDVLLQTGILSEFDWSGALDTTITTALNRFANEKMGCQNLRRLSHLSLRWTTDIDGGFEADGNGESIVWRQHFSPAMPMDRPIGAFALRGNGSDFESVEAERWATHIASVMSEDTASDCVGVLAQMVDFLGGWTPAWAYDKAFEEAENYDEVEDENDDDPGYDTHARESKRHLERFKEIIPNYGVSHSFDLARLESAVEKANRKKLACLPMLKASLCCARYMERLYQVPRNDHALCHLGFSYYSGFPPILILWKEDGDAMTDPCVRIYDDWGELLMQEAGTDIVWLHGWDDEKPGGGDTPGTITRSVWALALVLGLVALLDKLIEMWQADVPAVGSAPRRPTLIEVFAEEERGDAFAIAEELLCKS